jgi:VanZ family protein
MDRRTIAAWAVTVVVLGLCLMPRAWFPRREESPRRIPNLDKVIHFGMFAAFGAAWVIAAKDASGRRARAAWVFAAAAALAIGTELAQGHPAIDRDPDLMDALADCLGGLAGILVALPKRGTGTSTGPPV